MAAWYEHPRHKGPQRPPCQHEPSEWLSEVVLQSGADRKAASTLITVAHPGFGRATRLLSLCEQTARCCWQTLVFLLAGRGDNRDVAQSSSPVAVNNNAEARDPLLQPVAGRLACIGHQGCGRWRGVCAAKLTLEKRGC